MFSKHFFIGLASLLLILLFIIQVHSVEEYNFFDGGDSLEGSSFCPIDESEDFLSLSKRSSSAHDQSGKNNFLDPSQSELLIPEIPEEIAFNLEPGKSPIHKDLSIGERSVKLKEQVNVPLTSSILSSRDELTKIPSDFHGTPQQFIFSDSCSSIPSLDASEMSTGWEGLDLSLLNDASGDLASFCCLDPEQVHFSSLSNMDDVLSTDHFTFTEKKDVHNSIDEELPGMKESDLVWGYDGDDSITPIIKSHLPKDPTKKEYRRGNLKSLETENSTPRVFKNPAKRKKNSKEEEQKNAEAKSENKNKLLKTQAPKKLSRVRSKKQKKSLTKTQKTKLIEVEVEARKFRFNQFQPVLKVREGYYGDIYTAKGLENKGINEYEIKYYLRKEDAEREIYFYTLILAAKPCRRGGAIIAYEKVELLPMIVYQLSDIFVNEKKYAAGIVFRKAHDTLATILAHHYPMTKPFYALYRQIIFFKIATYVRYLHTRCQVAHINLNPNNIVLELPLSTAIESDIDLLKSFTLTGATTRSSSRLNVKWYFDNIKVYIRDFTQAVDVEKKKYRYVETKEAESDVRYWPPERMINCYTYPYQSDVWQLGIIFIELKIYRPLLLPIKSDRLSALVLLSRMIRYQDSVSSDAAGSSVAALSSLNAAEYKIFTQLRLQPILDSLIEKDLLEAFGSVFFYTLMKDPAVESPSIKFLYHSNILLHWALRDEVSSVRYTILDCLKFDIKQRESVMMLVRSSKMPFMKILNSVVKGEY